MDEKISETANYGEFLEGFIFITSTPDYHGQYHDLIEEIRGMTYEYFGSFDDTADNRQVLATAPDALALVCPNHAFKYFLLQATSNLTDVLQANSPQSTNKSIDEIIRKHDASVSVVDRLLLSSKVLNPVATLLAMRRADRDALEEPAA